MSCVTLDGSKITSGQYILAKSVFPFISGSSNQSSSVRPAIVEYFCKHSVFISECNSVSHIFAAVTWPMCHPFQYRIGKPYEIWCLEAFETCNKNFILPVHYISTVLLTASQVIDNQNVLVTVPLLLWFLCYYLLLFLLS